MKFVGQRGDLFDGGSKILRAARLLAGGDRGLGGGGGCFLGRTRDLLGANGIMDEYPIMRHMCNLETVKTYEGTDHIHTLVIGERVTGVAAYK